MRALIQRVSRAGVTLPGGESREVGRGLLIYLGVGKGDSEEASRRLVEKIVNLRIFPNEAGKFDRSLLDERGAALVISQFTLYGNLTKGRRPDFTAAAPPEEAHRLYDSFARRLEESGVPVKKGEFGAFMRIDSVNEGPVTLWLDTEEF